ncbi:hypothetical protein Mycsm_06930 (plasmid) [Mycobacterium sp. JS623]|uniref:hypothetical protein n=1 Tax=Mycobacterium sp. JS623 TaxID=212767 RepID=UPI0002A57D6A|nr:hypothetical protein [Mycobacterium sp. JS623]AGB27032.1 hypothetical protein Mycsm_06930 [Mycobacterium sp. JS623]
MTDRRNNAAKAAARQLQSRTGMNYRQALSATTRPTAVADTEVTLEQLIGPYIGDTSSNVWGLIEKLPDGACLTITRAASLSGPHDHFRQELVDELVAALGRKHLLIHLLVGDAGLCRSAAINYPGLQTAGIELRPGS